MKDSKKYSEKLLKNVRSLKRKYGKVEQPDYGMSAAALVYAVLSEHMNENAAASNLKKLQENFVDFNDLRVSRPEEITEILGKDTDEYRKIAEELTQALFCLFNKYDVVTFEPIEDVGKRQLRPALEKILVNCSRYVVGYVLLTVFEGHAVPLTAVMKDYLKANDLVHPESTDEEIEGFVERSIPVSQAYEDYEYLRKEAESTVKKPSAEKNSKKTAAKKQ